ncbi:MAG: hypothetical protein Q9201_002973 [Fulgogasparrea decipioides]
MSSSPSYAELLRLVQNTSLDELLQACHDTLFEQLQVQHKPGLTTLGTLTDPKGKSCPRFLRPWHDFPDIQRATYSQIRAALHPPQGAIRVFPSVKGIQDQRLMLNGLIASEEDLKRFQHKAVEQYVQLALQSIASIGSSHRWAGLGHGLEFHNHSHALRDEEKEVEERRQTVANKKVPPPANADQLCVTREDDQTRLVFIEEYKAPHKLTCEFLQVALSDVLDVREVRGRCSTSTDKDEKFIEDAQQLVAAAATQTYAYMLQGGLAYSCIVTGEAIVFLHLEEEDANTLYYHLAIPSVQVKHEDQSTPDYSFTAVSQLLTFSVLAAQSPQRGHEWRAEAVQRADQWTVDYNTLEHALETPRNERRNSPEHSKYRSRKVSLRKTYGTRSKRDDDDDHNSHTTAESSDGSLDPDTPTKSNRSRSNNTNHQKGGQGSSTSHSQQHRGYCTQACLLGLVQNSAIDEDCPNAALHPRRRLRPDHHLIGARTLKRLVREQLGTDLDQSCTDLKVHGARGMLFQITLESHGYIFVGKGTIDVFVPDLKHEGVVYNRLRSLQGKFIPVYLGNIDLITNWYEYGICILHMLLMSYGGTPIRTKDQSTQIQVKDFEAKLDRLGIQHRDLREPNMLWNQELQRLIFIDFERSTIEARVKKVPTRVLENLSPNQNLPGKQSTAELPNKTSTRMNNEMKQTPAAFAISDDENMTLELPIPSPKRPLVEKEEPIEEPPSKRHSQGEKPLVGIHIVPSILSDQAI